ncbi:MAG: hypothetical protein WAK12_02430 [Acidimicrobiales bacterium]
MTNLTLKIEGPRNRVPASALAVVLTESLSILEEIQQIRAAGHSVTWYITGLSIGSAQAVITAEDISDDSFVIGSEFVKAIQVVEQGESLPEYFSAKSLTGLKRMARPFGTPGVKYLEVSVRTGDRKRAARTVRATGKIVENLDKLQAPRSRSIGSITGVLDTISTRPSNKFLVFDRVSRRPVTCQFKDEQLDEIKDSFVHRVVVSGIIVRNSSGQPLRIEDAEFVVLGEPLALTGLVGIDPGFTGGLSLPEYFERVG